MSKGTEVAMVDHGARMLYGFDPQSVETIKNTVAVGATNHELSLFLYTANKFGLDPLLGEIWFVKFGSTPSIQVGRDGLLVIAQRDEGYETPISQAVYSKDEFELDVSAGRVRHIITQPADRGTLVGAYCITPHKYRAPVVTWVSYEEYSRSWGQKNPVWKTNPAEMIRKVAESQSLRRQYAGTGLAGVYVQDEFGPGVPAEEPGKPKEPLQVSREELNAFIKDYQAKGLTMDELKQAFSEATGRKTMQGWPRSYAAFEAWKDWAEAMLAEKSAMAIVIDAEPVVGEEETKESQPELDLESARPIPSPDAPATEEQREEIIAFAKLLKRANSTPEQWLEGQLGIGDISGLTQNQAQDVILHLMDLAASKRHDKPAKKKA